MSRVVTISAWSVLEAGTPPDVSFVPPLIRRRFSPLQKIFFALAKAVTAENDREVVFASRDGEDTLTRRIVDDFHADGSVSPQRFSTSVYNAAPGLWSVQTKNRAAYTALAAGDDSIECALIEALGAPALPTVVYAEETGGGYGAAVRFGDGPDGRRIAVTMGDAESFPRQNETGGRYISFRAWADFLSGRTRELNGRWLNLRDIG